MVKVTSTEKTTFHGEMTSVRLSWNDSVARKLLQRLERLDSERANLVLVRAAKHEGEKALTAVRRVMKRESGLGKYGYAMTLVKAKQPTFHNPALVIYADGVETNVGKFGARVARKWISAKPWNNLRKYRTAFLVGMHNEVFYRTGPDRYPIAPIFGPNIARELQRHYTLEAWKGSLVDLNKRVAHELERELISSL